MSDRSNPVVFVKAYRGSSSGSRLNLDNILVSFSYDEDEGKADKITLTIDNYDLKQFDNPLWNAGTLLEVTWGYPGKMTKPRAFHIEELRGFHTLTIVGVSALILMNKVTKTRSFENMSKEEVVAKLYSELIDETIVDKLYSDMLAPKFVLVDKSDTNQNSPQVIDSCTIVKNSASDIIIEKDSSKDKKEVITQRAETNLQLAKRLAVEEGKVLYLDQEGLHYHARNYGQKPYKNYKYMVGMTEGDIISIDMTQTWLHADKKGAAKVSTYNPETKTVEVVNATGDTTKRVTASKGDEKEFTAQKAAEIGFFVEGSATGTSPPGTSIRGVSGAVLIQIGSESAGTTAATSAKTAAETQLKRAAENALELSMVIVGDPNFVAKSVIELTCDSKRISRKYYVKSSKHTIDSSGYRISMRCSTDVGSETGAATANTKKPDPKNDPANASKSATIDFSVEGDLRGTSTNVRGTNTTVVRYNND